MPNTPIAALPYPSLSNIPDVPADVQALATASDSLMIPRYATTGARDTAIPTPTAGQFCYVTGTEELYVYKSSWVGAIPRVKVKLSDETVNNSTALQDDNELFMSVEASSIYRVLCHLQVNSNTTADIFVGWSGPASYTFAQEMIYRNRDTAGVSDWLLSEADSDDAVGLNNGSSDAHHLFIRGRVVTSASGTLTLRWAQATATAFDTKIMANSFIELHKIK